MITQNKAFCYEKIFALRTAEKCIDNYLKFIIIKLKQNDNSKLIEK